MSVLDLVKHKVPQHSSLCYDALSSVADEVSQMGEVFLYTSFPK